MTATRYAVALAALLLFLVGCTDDGVERGAPQEVAQEGEREYDKQPPSQAPTPPENTRLAKVCERAFA